MVYEKQIQKKMEIHEKKKKVVYKCILCKIIFQQLISNLMIVFEIEKKEIKPSLDNKAPRTFKHMDVNRKGNQIKFGKIRK